MVAVIRESLRESKVLASVLYILQWGADTQVEKERPHWISLAYTRTGFEGPVQKSRIVRGKIINLGIPEINHLK